MSIIDVCAKIQETLGKLEIKDVSKSDKTLLEWITLIDAVDRAEIENARLKPLIEALSSSVFKEIHISLILSQTDNYGSACVLARGCIEKVTYVLFFYDHPMAAYDWATNGTDLSFSSICEALSSKGYFELASGVSTVGSKSPTKAVNDLRACYRYFSEYVHGKFKFLEGVEEPLTVAENYHQNLIKAAKSLNSLFHIRFGKL